MGNREIGIIGERAAAELLQTEGYEIKERNYRCRSGEIDLIAVRGSEVSFVEVKTRRNHHYGRPCEAIGAEKIQHIRRAAAQYLRECGSFYDDVRFHVVEVTLEQIRDAF